MAGEYPKPYDNLNSIKYEATPVPKAKGGNRAKRGVFKSGSSLGAGRLQIVN